MKRKFVLNSKNQINRCILIFILALLILVGLFNEFCEAEGNKVIKFLPDGGGPKWSPDGGYVSYYLNDYLWLYDVASDSSWQAVKYQGNKYEWLNDSQIVFFKVEKTRENGDITRKIILIFFNIYNSNNGVEYDSTQTFTVGSYSRPRSSPGLINDNAGTVALIINDTAIVLSTDGKNRGTNKNSSYLRASIIGHPGSYIGKPLPDDKGVWLLNIHGERLLRVSENSDFILPILSPNGKLVALSDPGGYTTILNLNGDVIARLYNADSECWGSNSDIIYFTKLVQGDETIEGGDLYSYSIITEKLSQLTNNPEIAEFHPQISPDGTMLAYRTYHKKPIDGIEILLLEEVEQ